MINFLCEFRSWTFGRRERDCISVFGSESQKMSRVNLIARKSFQFHSCSLFLTASSRCIHYVVIICSQHFLLFRFRLLLFYYYHFQNCKIPICKVKLKGMRIATESAIKSTVSIRLVISSDWVQRESILGKLPMTTACTEMELIYSYLCISIDRRRQGEVASSFAFTALSMSCSLCFDVICTWLINRCSWPSNMNSSRSRFAFR